MRAAVGKQTNKNGPRLFFCLSGTTKVSGSRRGFENSDGTIGIHTPTFSAENGNCREHQEWLCLQSYPGTRGFLSQRKRRGTKQ